MDQIGANSHRLVQQTRVLEEQFHDFEGRSRAAAPSSSTSAVQAPPAPERSCQVTLLEGRIEGHRAEFDALAAQLMSRSQELQDRISDQARRHEEMRTESRTTSERTRIVAARIEEIEHGI